MQWVFDKRMIWGDGADHLSLVSRCRVDRRPAERSAHRFGSRGASRVTAQAPGRHVWFADRSFVSVRPRSRWPPASPRPIASGDGEHRSEWLFLAGDWIDTGLPATTIGAPFEVVNGPRKRF